MLILPRVNGSWKIISWWKIFLYLQLFCIIIFTTYLTWIEYVKKCIIPFFHITLYPPPFYICYTLFVCPSICPPSVDTILSMYVLRECTDFFWKFVHLLLTIWRCALWIFILIGYLFSILRLFSVFGLSCFLITRNSVRNIMKNFDLNSCVRYTLHV